MRPGEAIELHGRMHLPARPLRQLVPSSTDPLVSDPLLSVMKDPDVGLVAGRNDGAHARAALTARGQNPFSDPVCGRRVELQPGAAGMADHSLTDTQRTSCPLLSPNVWESAMRETHVLNQSCEINTMLEHDEARARRT